MHFSSLPNTTKEYKFLLAKTSQTINVTSFYLFGLIIVRQRKRIRVQKWVSQKNKSTKIGYKRQKDVNVKQKWLSQNEKYKKAKIQGVRKYNKI